jgi:hypothetical protein
VTGREVVDPRLVLDQVIDAWTILERPFHRGHESRQRESLSLSRAEPLLEQREHRIRNEVAAPKVGFFPDPQFQLLGCRRGRRVDPNALEPAKVFLPQLRVNDVQRTLVTIKGSRTV